MSDPLTSAALRRAVSSGLSKAEANRAHAKTRALQRFGLVLKRRDLDAIVAFILAGQATQVHQQDEHTTHWLLNVGGQNVVAVFDAETDTVVTFITPEMSRKTQTRKPWRKADFEREDEDE